MLRVRAHQNVGYQLAHAARACNILINMNAAIARVCVCVCLRGILTSSTFQKKTPKQIPRSPLIKIKSSVAIDRKIGAHVGNTVVLCVCCEKREESGLPSWRLFRPRGLLGVLLLYAQYSPIYVVFVYDEF